MLKNINDIFRHKGIFVFSHLHFNTIRAHSNGSGVGNFLNQSLSLLLATPSVLN